MDETMRVTIDAGSGCCFGVARAIEMAERELGRDQGISCLGDLVHNSREMERLQRRGLRVIEGGDLTGVEEGRVLFRAHGEPPATYASAQERGIEVVDATCPVVLKLQKRIREVFRRQDGEGAQVVIFGRKGHAEVNGLVGQTEGRAVVVETAEDLAGVDFGRDVHFFVQTTMSYDSFRAMADVVESRMRPPARFRCYDTVCRQVNGRIESLRRFAAENDVVLFVAGAKSSNGRALCRECREVNGRTHRVEDVSEIRREWLDGARSVGVCGATSTPRWQMEEVERFVLFGRGDVKLT
jgi:4-hydroxy-3-methylbut-2-enyl diphosphate reductase